MKSLISKENIDGADGSLANQNPYNRFQEVDSQNAAQITNGIGRSKRTKTPSRNDCQLVLLQRLFALSEMRRLCALEIFVQP